MHIFFYPSRQNRHTFLFYRVLFTDTLTVIWRLLPAFMCAGRLQAHLLALFQAYDPLCTISGTCCSVHYFRHMLLCVLFQAYAPVCMLLCALYYFRHMLLCALFQAYAALCTISGTRHDNNSCERQVIGSQR